MCLGPLCIALGEPVKPGHDAAFNVETQSMDSPSDISAKAARHTHAGSDIGITLVYLLGFSFFLMIIFLIWRDQANEDTFLLELPSRQIERIEFVSQSRTIAITDPATIRRISYAISGNYVSKQSNRTLDPQSDLYITSGDGKKFLIPLVLDKENEEALIMKSHPPPKGGYHASKELFRALADLASQLPKTAENK